MSGLSLMERLELAECHAVHGPDVTDAVSLIQSLKTELASYVESDGNLRKRVEELEAEVTEMENILETSIPSKVRELEAKLENIEGLQRYIPVAYLCKLVRVEDVCLHQSPNAAVVVCADELEALLGKES